MRASLSKWSVTLFLLRVLIPDGARAERVDMPPAWLKKTATHVIVGTVNAVYESTATDNDWKTTRYVAEVRIKSIEKGEGLRAGELVYVRYWHRQWISKNPPEPNTNGHRGLPDRGTILRIYLAKNAYNGFGQTNDDGFDVVGANGFEKLKE